MYTCMCEEDWQFHYQHSNKILISYLLRKKLYSIIKNYQIHLKKIKTTHTISSMNPNPFAKN